MKELLIVCFAVVAVWLIVSQVIAGLISSNRDHVVNMWACVFLAPFFTPMILWLCFISLLPGLQNIPDFR